ncbi:MAG: protein kinase [bacterium]
MKIKTILFFNFLIFKCTCCLIYPSQETVLSNRNGKTVTAVETQEGKFAKLKYSNFNKDFENEFAKLLSLNHSNIIEIISLDMANRIIIEELGDCSLYNFIRNPNYFFKKYEFKTNLTLNEIKIDIIKQIIEVLKYLHLDKNILHLDVKPQNFVLFFIENRIIVKLIDFASCEEVNTEINKINGTFEYAPPEMLDSTKIYANFSSDIYSLGLTIYFILNGISIGQAADSEINSYYQVTTDDESQKSFIYLIKHLKWRPELLNIDYLEINNLIKSCWTHNPSDRPTIKECYAIIKKLF